MTPLLGRVLGRRDRPATLRGSALPAKAIDGKRLILKGEVL